MDFNVKVHKRFTDKILDYTLQLAFKNDHLLSFSLISKKKILSIWRTIKLHFPTTGLGEVRFSSYQATYQNTLKAEADTRSRLSSIKADIKEKRMQNNAISFCFRKYSFFIKNRLFV